MLLYGYGLHGRWPVPGNRQQRWGAPVALRHPCKPAGACPSVLATSSLAARPMHSFPHLTTHEHKHCCAPNAARRVDAPPKVIYDLQRALHHPSVVPEQAGKHMHNSMAAWAGQGVYLRKAAQQTAERHDHAAVRISRERPGLQACLALCTQNQKIYLQFTYWHAGTRPNALLVCAGPVGVHAATCTPSSPPGN
jgi:hypothetical protein